ncbi:MAG: nucleotide exchange factor GrpE [Planctomycetota bacterium]|nr:nucleotide exchange factor GrpE [Planctomycetota bacterium]
MDRVDESNERPDGTTAEPDELPVHGDDQPDVETPAPVEDTPEDTPEDAAPEPPAELTAEEVAALQAKAADAEKLADKVKRVEAEFVNETKRIRRQAEQDRKYAIEKVVVDLLPVVDALNSAGEALGEDEASQPMRDGLALVEKQMQGIFERYGIAAIDALGQPFDPSRHQAMMMVENPEFEPQTVCTVMRAGYELNGRVVRPAEVIVVKAPAEQTDAGEAGGEGEAEAGGEEA